MYCLEVGKILGEKLEAQWREAAALMPALKSRGVTSNNKA